MNTKVAFSLFAALFTFTAHAACPQSEDVVQCQVMVSGEPPQNTDFSVFSSTFLCDGKPNPFHVEEFVLNNDLKAEVYMSWDSVRLSIYKNNQKDSPLAEIHSPRSPEAFQSVYTSLTRRDFAQIICSTVQRK